MALSQPLLGFDEAFTNPRAVYPENLTNEELMTGDWAKIGPVMQDFNPYFLDKRYFIQLPTQYSFVAWYPWVQNYHGKYSLGYFNSYNFVNYIWLDQNLKEKMTGRR